MPLPVNADELPERSTQAVHRLVKCRAEPCADNYVQPSWGGRKITQLKLEWEALSYEFQRDEPCPICTKTGCQLKHRAVNIYSNPDREAANQPNDEQTPFGQLAAAFRAIGCPWGRTPEKYEGQIFLTEDKQIGRPRAWQTVPVARLDHYDIPANRPTFTKRKGGTSGRTAVAPPPAPDETEAYVVIAAAMDGATAADELTILTRKVPMLAREPYLSKALSQTLIDELVARGLGTVDDQGTFREGS